ncbi:Mut7-C RNAse domain-containing protein [Candidatus Bathyarchaeota archaeon]|nr:Mut7-C RNAse domain-containing protein [Candidatus Bathyarchaeota archaeon]
MRFLADGMLGNITRWLRLLGYDVKYEKLRNDNELLNESRMENRILLTADVELFRLARRRGLEAVLVKEHSTVEGLSRLSRKLNLQLTVNHERSRCPTCGSPIMRVEKRLVEGKVPDGTYDRYRRFWMCTSASCSKIYWRGSHWKKIKQTLEKAKKMK